MYVCLLIWKKCKVCKSKSLLGEKKDPHNNYKMSKPTAFWPLGVMKTFFKVCCLVWVSCHKTAISASSHPLETRAKSNTGTRISMGCLWTCTYDGFVKRCPGVLLFGVTEAWDQTNEMIEKPHILRHLCRKYLMVIGYEWNIFFFFLALHYNKKWSLCTSLLSHGDNTGRLNKLWNYLTWDYNYLAFSLTSSLSHIYMYERMKIYPFLFLFSTHNQQLS